MVMLQPPGWRCSAALARQCPSARQTPRGNPRHAQKGQAQNEFLRAQPGWEVGCRWNCLLPHWAEGVAGGSMAVRAGQGGVAWDGAQRGAGGAIAKPHSASFHHDEPQTTAHPGGARERSAQQPGGGPCTKRAVRRATALYYCWTLNGAGACVCTAGTVLAEPRAPPRAQGRQENRWPRKKRQ